MDADIADACDDLSGICVEFFLLSLTFAAPFEIYAAGEAQTAANGAQAMHLLESDGRLFRRRAVKGFGTDSPTVCEWIVAELAGVRVYYDGLQVVVTRRDITP